MKTSTCFSCVTCVDKFLSRRSSGEFRFSAFVVLGEFRSVFGHIVAEKLVLRPTQTFRVLHDARASSGPSVFGTCLLLSYLAVVSARRFTTTPGYHSFGVVFSSSVWDWYILIKHVSEWMILFVMLWILHDPGDDDSVVGSDDSRGMAGVEGEEYWEVPAEEDDGYGGGGGDSGSGSGKSCGSRVSGPASELAADGQRVDKYGAI